MNPIRNAPTIAMIMSVSPNLNSSDPISGMVADADAISHTMNSPPPSEQTSHRYVTCHTQSAR
jgi:hypothetical protein